MMLSFSEGGPSDAARSRLQRPVLEKAELVGPNSVLQLAESLRDGVGEAEARAVFASAAALGAYWRPPSDMVDEKLAARLFQATLVRFGSLEGDRLLHDAGERTGDYVADNRVPAMARRLLGYAPRGLGAAILMRAIEANAWTFAGSGTCSVHLGRVPRVEIAQNPLATPGCPWHCGVFERLFAKLLGAVVEVAHPQCCARGDAVCAFDISASPSRRRSLERRR